MKRFLSLFLTLALCLSLLPMAASAADTGKAIQLVTSGAAANITGAQKSNVYFGTYQQSSDGRGGYNVEPIKWRVLENDATAGELFLLADQNLDGRQYHKEIAVDVTWETCTTREWLNASSADSFISQAFTASEKMAIPAVTVVTEDNPRYPYTTGGNDTTDQVFLLSINEAAKTEYGFSGDWDETGDASGRVADNTDYAASHTGMSDGDNTWWLRSPGLYGNCAADVSGDGSVDTNGRYVYGYESHYEPQAPLYDTGVRPALHVNLQAVLFTSAAKGGKTGTAGVLGEIPDYDGSDWKLTLLDAGDITSRHSSFDLSTAATAAAPGHTFELEYTGAATGENEYVSVLLFDDTGETPLLYGSSEALRDASGTVLFTVPVSLEPGNYKLKVFNEQKNGDGMTDYASGFQDAELVVTHPIMAWDEDSRTVKATVVNDVNYIPVTAADTEWGTEGAETWYVADSTITNNNRIVVHGTVNLVLHATLTAAKGITVTEGNTLNIYESALIDGTLYAGTDGSSVTCEEGSAGIGGAPYGTESCGTIAINSGTVIAAGGKSAVGIGGSA